MKVALIHDYLNQFGGAERVLQELSVIFPRASIYTLVYDEKSTGGAFAQKNIKTSFLQKIPFARTRHRVFPLFMPVAAEEFDLSKFDLVISDSASFAKGVITKPHTIHISYCHTPLRYAWDDSHRYLEEFGYPGFIKKIAPFFISYLRFWDKEASRRVDYFIANSDFVAKRVKKYYRRKAEVIHPPVDFDYFSRRRDEKLHGKNEEYFLVVGRLVAYKRFDVAVRAFNKYNKKLKIVGKGPEEKRLKKMASDNIEFLGLVSDDKLSDLYQNARALIFPQEEDFGITALEAMSAGRPVIAFKGGGVLEVVKEGKSGVYFNSQGPESLLRALQNFQNQGFDSQAIKLTAQEFSPDRFRKKLTSFIEKVMGEKIQ